MKKSNDVMLKTVTNVAAVIILAFSIHMFVSGHHNPGGGFIGGLAFTAAFVLLFLAHGIEKVRRNSTISFRAVAASGVLISILTGAAGMIGGKPFLNQTFGYVDLPIFGKTELATAVLFDVGVALAVIGTAMTIILAIGEDR